MAVLTFEAAQKAVYDGFIAAFHPGTLDRDTQLALGPEPFDFPDESLAAHLTVFQVPGGVSGHGASGTREYQRNCIAMAEFRFVPTTSDATMNTVVKLFMDTFEGVDVGPGCHFVDEAVATPPVHDGRWATRTVRAPFYLFERK